MNVFMRLKAQIMDSLSISRTLRRLAHEVIERGALTEDTVIIGIQRRGAIVAERLASELLSAGDVKVPVGTIDITFYRDDLSRLDVQPVMNGTDIPFDVNKKNIILVDDVLYTGRTVRCAIDGIFRKGRPDRVQLLVLIDRGQRELPFKPDYVGKNIPTASTEVVRVRLEELDEESMVEILEKDVETV